MSGKTVYKPKVSCALYEPIKNECAGLKYLVCAECGKCSFYKTRKRAAEDRLNSIAVRHKKGLFITATEKQELQKAMKKKSARGGA